MTARECLESHFGIVASYRAVNKVMGGSVGLRAKFHWKHMIILLMIDHLSELIPGPVPNIVLFMAMQRLDCWDNTVTDKTELALTKPIALYNFCDALCSGSRKVVYAFGLLERSYRLYGRRRKPHYLLSPLGRALVDAYKNEMAHQASRIPDKKEVKRLLKENLPK